MARQHGSIRLFTAFGINVYLHWTWFLLLVILPTLSPNRQITTVDIAVLVSLFGIVLLHEFGHALACRSVGGRASHITLWPLGGIAFVEPPPRPGAVLWSIAAGPLVNLILMPVTVGLLLVLIPRDQLIALIEDRARPTPMQFYLLSVTFLNIGLFIFNMMPVYPLDGGQIVHAILWRFMGYARSLRAVSYVGLGVTAVVVPLTLYAGEPFLLALAVFVGYRAFQGMRVARRMLAMEAQIEAKVAQRVNPWR